MRRFLLALALLGGSSDALRVRTTFYHAAPGSLSACGKALPGSFRQIAVSRDLRRAYPCGTRVRVTLHERKGGVKTFVAVVQDVMGPHARHSIDIKLTLQRLKPLDSRFIEDCPLSQV